MYRACSCQAAEVQEDPAHPGRYRGVVCGRMYGDPSLLDAELAMLGYTEVDADQWGASYRHRRRSTYRAELDESADETGLLRLELLVEDMTEPQAEAVCDELQHLYASLASRFSCSGDGERCPYAFARCGRDPWRAEPQESFA